MVDKDVKIGDHSVLFKSDNVKHENFFKEK